MLNAAIKAESKAESADVLKHVEGDRKLVIQATIVRYACILKPDVLSSWDWRNDEQCDEISKDSQTRSKSRVLLGSFIIGLLTYWISASKALVTATIEQLASRFNPKISDIKKAIDGLLDKEYIERVSLLLNHPGIRHWSDGWCC